MVVFSGRKPGGLGNTGFVAVLVAPETGEVLGVIDVDRSPAYAPLFLHGALWAGAGGRLLLGCIAIGTLIMLPLGLYLWWPPRKRLLQKLSPRPWRSTFLYAGRLHDWTGAWSLIFLIVLTGTGLYMVKPEWVEPALMRLPGPAPHQPSDREGCTGEISFDLAIKKRRNDWFPRADSPGLAPEDVQALRPWELIFKSNTSDACP